MQSTRLTLLAAIAALVVAGCGGDDEDASDGGGERPTGTSPSASAPATGDETTRTSPPATGTPEDGESGGDQTSPGSGEAPAPQRSPGRGCLTGSYVSVSFVGKRNVDSPIGSISLSGRGRGLGLAFTGSRWTMRGVGSKPMSGEALGIKGTLQVHGSARGRLIRAPGGRLRFRQTGSRGTVTLTGLGQTFELPVSVVAPAVVPDGRARVTCRGERLTIDSDAGVLRLVRP